MLKLFGLSNNKELSPLNSTQQRACPMVGQGKGLK